MINDFFKEYKGFLDFKTVYAVYSKWDQENDRYYYPEEYPDDDLEEDDYQNDDTNSDYNNKIMQ
ncbi:hypothetical protein DW228_06300 [Bacteroides fragilis]|uniref:Uncharacterized protein n=1 Tax=Bacteroides fragilis TaxID=817 RepID=A0A396C1E8_BACFG|nr:hypothetical protein [Bacteroides fragilis]RHH14408.1 hypothetical protein DW228_06300 [Bacteroides fragilis]